MPDYSKGKIYKIVNSENDMMYVGSTTKQYLSNRMAGHRTDAKRRGKWGALYKAMNEIGADKFKISLIENYPCDSLEELEAREYKIMKKYKSRKIELYNLVTEEGHSVESKAKMSKARKQRGSVCFGTTNNIWIFSWYENGKCKSKSFSVNKYGERSAYRKAVRLQNEIYPIESDSD